jgi:hypothetical protein
MTIARATTSVAVLTMRARGGQALEPLFDGVVRIHLSMPLQFVGFGVEPGAAPMHK